MSDVQVGGTWGAIQDNGFTASFDIEMQGQVNLIEFGINNPFAFGTRIDGGTRCSHSNGTVRSHAATGYVQNDFFQLTVTWNNNTQGLYTGFLRRSGDKKGRITGDTRDLIHGSHARWESDRTFPL